jgi:hypothetical protein
MGKYILACLLIFSLGSYAETSPRDYTYRYWDLGASKKRDEYQFMLLRLALEKTTPSYGKYKLIKNDEKYTSMRSTRELERGISVNVTAFPMPVLGIKDHGYSTAPITIKKPLLHGLLGYRKLVIRRSDLSKFEKISSTAELQHLAAGQGRDWEDINVYRYNHFKVVDNADYFNLFAMLAAGRFDYIPLSVIEIDDIMTSFPKYANDFTVVPNLIIYYPFPVLFNISGHQPELAERLSKGLDLVSEDGSLDQLFQKYFSDELQKIKADNLKAIILTSPSIPESLGLSSPSLLKKYTTMH